MKNQPDYSEPNATILQVGGGDNVDSLIVRFDGETVNRTVHLAAGEKVIGGVFGKGNNRAHVEKTPHGIEGDYRLRTVFSTNSSITSGPR